MKITRIYSVTQHVSNPKGSKRKDKDRFENI